MIQINSLTKIFGGRILFQDLDLKLFSGNKLGFVGRNGSGKSTLFKIILGEEAYDGGEILIPKNYRIGTLRQHLHFTHKTVRDECASVLEGDAQHDATGGRIQGLKEQFRYDKVKLQIENMLSTKEAMPGKLPHKIEEI